jgi:hypothetical protein
MPVANFSQKYSRAGGQFTKKMPIDIITWICSRINRVTNENFDNQLAETVENLKTIGDYSPTIDLSNRVKKVA